MAVSNDERMYELAAAHVLDMEDLRSSQRVKARIASQVDKEDISEVIEEALENIHLVRICTNSRDLKRAFVSKASDPLNCRGELTGNNGKLTKERASKLFAHIECTDPEYWDAEW